MNELMKFLGDANTPMAVATTMDNMPYVRFLSFKMVVDGEIYLCTSKEKDFFKQLVANNALQISSLPNSEKEWVRLDANVEFVENLDLKKKAFEVLPLLKMAYQTPENSNCVLLKLVNIDAKKQSLSGKSEKIEL